VTNENLVRQLRARAAFCRRAAAIPTNGGHATDRLLLDLAERLERDAAEIEATLADKGES
jgi:hypothetical protein